MGTAGPVHILPAFLPPLAPPSKKICQIDSFLSLPMNKDLAWTKKDKFETAPVLLWM